MTESVLMADSATHEDAQKVKWDAHLRSLTAGFASHAFLAAATNRAQHDDLRVLGRDVGGGRFLAMIAFFRSFLGD